MQRYMPGVLPAKGTGAPAQHTEADMRPLAGAERLCGLIRSEHGRAGVARFIGVLEPFVPRDFLEQLAKRTGVEAPPAQTTHEKRSAAPQASGPAIKPEQLLKLMNMTGSGGGLDPATLLQLIGEMGK